MDSDAGDSETAGREWITPLYENERVAPHKAHVDIWVQVICVIKRPL